MKVSLVRSTHKGEAVSMRKRRGGPQEGTPQVGHTPSRYRAPGSYHCASAMIVMSIQHDSMSTLSSFTRSSCKNRFKVGLPFYAQRKKKKK